jgi:ATP-binding cassette subfamily B multidrug efflux pump
MGRMGSLGHVEKARNPRQVLMRLLGYLRPHLVLLALIMVMVIASSALDLVGPYLMGVAIDRYISAKDVSGLTRIAMFMLVSYVSVWLIQWRQNFLMVSIAQNVLRTLRRRLFEHLQTLSLGYFDTHPTGEMMSRLTNDIDAINQLLSHGVVDLMSSSFAIIGVAAAMFSLNIWLALGTLSIMPIMLFVTARVGKGARKGFRELQGGLGALNATMEENISGARVVQAFGRQKTVINEFGQRNVVVRDAGIRAQTWAMVLRPLLMILGNLDIAIVAGLGGWLAIQDRVSVGVVASFIIYARRFFRPLDSLAEIYNSIQSALAGAERVFQTMDEVPQIRDAEGAVELSDPKGLVEFEHVYFGYVPDVPVLVDINLRAETGQVVALVGPTGAGKTTIVSVLSRFYEVNQGRILIDGRDIREYTQDSLRRQLGIVLQDTFLFSASVMENIRYGRLEATDEECIDAARLANAHQFIERLPEGYKTELSERASNLSQGQRQLLAIARAALADPHILILDEATSSVDTRTELHIQEALLKLMQGRTSFVIAHRLSTIRKADQLLVIDDGRIIERGTHESLLAEQGFYYRLYMTQFRTGVLEPERAV